MNTRIKLSFSTFAMLMGVSCFSAEMDPYAEFVRLEESDTSRKSSWNQMGSWSNSQSPSIENNYYVPADKVLWYSDGNDWSDDAKGIWAGGQLAVAGILHVTASANNTHAPLITNLVLLAGSELRTGCYGPFGIRNNTTSEVAVVGTMDNPARISQHYSTSTLRVHILDAYFDGASDSALMYIRPYETYSGNPITNNFYCALPNFTFSKFPGTFIIRGGNTVCTPVEKHTYNFPLTAFKVDEGASCYFNYHKPKYVTATGDAYLRSIDFSGGTIVMAAKSGNGTYKSYPVINVSERFSGDENSEVKISNVDINLIKGVSPDNPDAKNIKIAHLGAGVSDVLNSLNDVKVSVCNSDYDYGDLNKYFSLFATGNPDGSKDVYVAVPGIVTMTNLNVESTGSPVGAVSYGAFEDGHAGDWSNLVTPSKDSTLHYWIQNRLCFFEDTVLPNATLTFAYTKNDASWKKGSVIRFKEINMVSGFRFGLWAEDPNRSIVAEKLNLVRNLADHSLYTSIRIGQDSNPFMLTIDAPLYGDGSLRLSNRSGKVCTFALLHANTNYNGKIMFGQYSEDEDSPYLTNLILSDARSLGGRYTVSGNGYDAIEFSGFPVVKVTNDVVFSEQTRGIRVHKGVRFDVESERTMILANQVTYEGVIEKTGLGILDLAGKARFIDGAEDTSPAVTSNIVHLTEGSVKMSSAEATDGLVLVVEDGTKIIIPSDSEKGYFNVKWNEPLKINTNDGKVSVEIDLVDGVDQSRIAVPICTFNSVAAEQIPVSVFALKKMSNGMRVKSVEKISSDEGYVTYMATYEKCGLKIVLR